MSLLDELKKWTCGKCSQPLDVKPYPKGRGFRLDCKGTNESPHRLRIYFDGFREDASLPAKVTSLPAPRGNRASELLSRVRGLVGDKEKDNDGNGIERKAA
jgi:hypothetical protein